MRTKRLISGLDNNQRIRFFVDGFGMYCRVKDIENIASTQHRVAVWLALERIGNDNIVHAKRMEKPVKGFATVLNGVNVQVDLCDE